MLVILGHPALAFGAEAIAYGTEIVVPGDPALADQMQQISQLVARQGDVDSELQLQRRAAADITRLEAAARAAGYYDAKLSYDIDKQRQPWRVTVKVALGAPIACAGQGHRTGRRAARGRRFNPGISVRSMWAQSAAILAAEDKLLRYYTTRGWPLAKVTAHQAVIDRADQACMSPTRSFPARPRFSAKRTSAG
jgi:outer membrane translocation and assembly module TamA